MTSNVLRVRKLPPDLTIIEKTDLLKHFGALDVVYVGTKNVTAFASFSSVEAAGLSLKRLHQLDVLGHLLNVDYAPQKSKTEELPSTTLHFGGGKDTNEEATSNGESQGAHSYERFLQRLNAWSLGLNLSQPPPSHISYQYPPPTVEVLANIARVLCAVPKFYTQVLHLMNKMNLPSPFHQTCLEHREAMHVLLRSTMQREQVQEVVSADERDFAAEEAGMQTSSTESEIESEAEAGPRLENIVPNLLKPKRKAPKRPRLHLPSLAVSKKPSSQGRTSEKGVAEVFDIPEELGKQRKIQVHLPTTQEHLTEDAKLPSGEETKSEEGFGILFPLVPERPSVDSGESKEPEEGDGSTISIQQLKRNRIPERDRALLSVFRGYQSGAPSCRLYVKNLSKTVTPKDLHFIFRAFLSTKPEDQESNNIFDIRHMTEGRMKGQAFITFPNSVQAQSALKETNGYILHDKPMVVQFARSAKPKVE